MRAVWPAAALLLAGCSHRPPPAPATPAHYVVGAAYQMGGTWYYPRESFRYDATGLAERLDDQRRLTADGETFDPTAMAGAHQTLQLPTIARVTNLENGRQILIRINDRGPANPGRILGLTRRAADLLGAPPAAPIRVRVEVENQASQALRDQLHGGPAGATAAPLGEVTAEALPPPPGGAASRTSRVAQQLPHAETGPASEPAIPDRLPETVQQVTPQPGQLWLRAGQFSQVVYANAVKTRLSQLPVEIQREVGARRPGYIVMAGPFASAQAADAALDQAHAAGVTDAVIVVE